jgi:tetratricopeptide (TPR) repeat protein
MESIRAMRLQICLLAAVLAVVLTGCGGAQARYASHLERGKQYLAAGNLDKAGVEFRNAMQIQPKDPDALFLNGRVAELRGDIRLAAGLYQAAIDARPEYEQARARLGKLYVFGGAPQRALEIIGPGILEHPDDPDLLAVRAAARHQLKDDANARADAERAVQLAPVNENAVGVLAALYEQAGDRSGAISLVSSAVRQLPSSADLRGILVSLYLATDQPEKAEEQMRRIIDIKPREMSPRAQLAMHFVRAHKLDAAQGVLEEAVAAFAKNKERSKADEAKLILVEFISTQRSREQGEKTLRGFISQEPGDLDLRFGLGALLQRTGATQEAVATYQEVIRRDGTGAKGLMARNRIAAIQVSQGHLDQARKLVAEVLEKNPRDDDALILRADMELQGNDPTGAIADLRAVLRNQPRSVPLQRTLAQAYMKKGETALAEEALRAAVEAGPNEPSTRVELAQLLTQSGRAEQAASMLEEAVRLMPQDPQVREALVRTYLAKHDFAAARTAAEDLKTLRADSAIGFYLAGVIAYEQKRLDDSKKELERALELQPGTLEPLAMLAQVEIARGKPALAIARVQSAVDRDPKQAQTLNLLGELYLQGRNFQSAAVAFTQAAALQPRWWLPHRNLALAKTGSNDTQGAVLEYQAAASMAPGEPQLILEAAVFFEKQARVDAAIAAYEALYKNNRGAQVLAGNNLAMLLVTYKTDRASLNRARELTSAFASSDNSELLDTNGWVSFKLGEYREALPVLERAIARTPNSQVIRYHLGMTELQLGLRDRARSNLEAALAGSANFSGSEEARTVLASLNAARSG